MIDYRHIQHNFKKLHILGKSTLMTKNDNYIPHDTISLSFKQKLPLSWDA